jgi:hypothetical protein
MNKKLKNKIRLLAAAVLMGQVVPAFAARTYKHPTLFWVRGLSIGSRYAPVIKEIVPMISVPPPADCNLSQFASTPTPPPTGQEPNLGRCELDFDENRRVNWESYFIFTNIGSNSQDITVTFTENTAVPFGVNCNLCAAPSKIEGFLKVFADPVEVTSNFGASGLQALSKTFTLAPNSSRLVRMDVRYFGAAATTIGIAGVVQFLGTMDFTVSIAQDTGGVLANGESFLTHDFNLITQGAPPSLGGSLGQTIIVNGGGSI